MTGFLNLILEVLFQMVVIGGLAGLIWGSICLAFHVRRLIPHSLIYLGVILTLLILENLIRYGSPFGPPY